MVLTLDEPLAVLKAAEEDDLADRARLIQMSHVAALRATEKSRIMKKMKIQRLPSRIFGQKLCAG